MTDAVQPSKPEFLVECWWNGEVERPLLNIGCRDRHLRTPIFTSAEMLVAGVLRGSNRDFFQIAQDFCVFINGGDYPVRLDYDQNRFYQQIVRARNAYAWDRDQPLRERQAAEAETLREQRERERTLRIHAELEERTTLQQRRRAAEAHEKETALSRAQRLCLSVCGQDIYHAVVIGHCFYLHSELGHTFIIDPTHKNTVWLTKDKPVGLCVYFTDNHVQQNKYDWMVATYLHLRKDPSAWFQTANEYYTLREAEWAEPTVRDSSWLLAVGAA